MARLTPDTAIKGNGWSFMVGWDGDDIANFTQNELEDMRKGAVQNMTRAQKYYVSQIKATLSRVLRVQSSRFSWSLGRHMHAAPGDPPAKITGDLIRTWKVGTRRWSQNMTVLTGWVESRHPAAGLFEFIGPRGTARLGIHPHPYIRPTLLRIADRLHDMVLGL